MKNVYEVFDEFEKAGTRKEKINILKNNSSYALRNILLGTYKPEIRFIFEEIPKYRPSDSPPGLAYSSIHQELGRAYLFEENNPRINPDLTLDRKRQLLIQILEALEAKEAVIYSNMILKDQKVKGLNRTIVTEAFPSLL